MFSTSFISTFSFSSLKVFSFFLCLRLTFCRVIIPPSFTRNPSCIFRFAHLLLIFSLLFESLFPQFSQNLENIIPVLVMVQLQKHFHKIPIPISKDYHRNRIFSKALKTQVYCSPQFMLLT